MADPIRMQRTITKSAVLEGFGFWSGEDVRVEFRPALPGTGIVFVRTDLPDQPRIIAGANHQVSKPRQTSLRHNDAQVDMIEHLMAALVGLQIDNCEIHVNQQEMPGLDGSSRFFTEALLKAGIVAQPAFRPQRVVYKKLRVGDENNWIEVSPSFTGKTCFIYHLDYPEDSPISSQSFRYVSAPENFITQIVACRTFLTKQEADQLLDAGLCQRVSSQDVLVFDKDGPIENKMLFPEECARHKLLDMLGDFSLGQCDWVGEFVAFRSGHHLNVECVKALLDKTVYIESDVVPIHKNLFTRKD